MSRKSDPHTSISQLAERQHGIVSVRQLYSLGLSEDQVRKRVEQGWLHRIHRALYSVGHRRLTRLGGWQAAVLAASERAALLAAVLEEHEAGSTVTRSELEERFLALCRSQRLPQPGVNVRILDLTVDFFWPPSLVAEVDGAATHLTRRAFQDDRDRDTLLTAAGYTVVRFTWRDVTRRPEIVARRLRPLLSRLRESSDFSRLISRKSDPG